MSKTRSNALLWCILCASAFSSGGATWAENSPRYKAIAIAPQAPPPSEAPPASPPGHQVWEVLMDDGYVSRSLARWAAQAGWQVVWDSPRDFPVTAKASVQGSFEEAVTQLVESLARSDSPMQAQIYRNKVVRIIRFEGQTVDLKSGSR